MAILKQNYLGKSRFKDQLWTKVSSNCTEEHWFYAVNERRLFIVTVTVFVIAGSFLLFDTRIVKTETINQVNNLDSINEKRLEQLQNKVDVLVSITPIVSKAGE